MAHRSPAELPPPHAPGQKIFYELSHALFFQQSRFGAAGSSEIRRSGKAKYRVATAGKYQVSKEGWSIVGDDLSELAPPSNYSEAAQTLEKTIRRTPALAGRLQIVRLSELK